MCEGVRGRRALVRALSWELGPERPSLGFHPWFPVGPQSHLLSRQWCFLRPLLLTQVFVPALGTVPSARSRDEGLRLFLPLPRTGAPYSQLSPLISEPAREWVRPSDFWQVGQAGGGWLSLECIGGYLQADAGETGIFHEAVPPGWAEGAQGQQDAGVLQGCLAERGQPSPPVFGP